MREPQPTEPELRIDVKCDNNLCWSYSRSYGSQLPMSWQLDRKFPTPPQYRSLHISTNFHSNPLDYIRPHLKIHSFAPLKQFPDTLKVLHLSDFPIECKSILKIRTLTEFALLGPGDRVHNPKIILDFLKKNTSLERVELNGSTFRGNVTSPIKYKLKNLKTLTVRVKPRILYYSEYHNMTDLIPYHFSDLPKDTHLIVEIDHSEINHSFDRALSSIMGTRKRPTHLRMDCPGGKLEFCGPNSKNKVSIAISNIDTRLTLPVEPKFRSTILRGEVRPFFKKVEDIRLVYHSKPPPDPRPETLQELLRLFPALKTLHIDKSTIEEGTIEDSIEEDHPLTRQPFQSTLDQLEGAST